MTEKYKAMLLVIVATATVIGVLGVTDLKNAPYAGFFSGPNNDVVRVSPGSPADEAGLEVGDLMESIGGIAVTDTKARSRRLRPKIGETRTFVVGRDATKLELD